MIDLSSSQVSGFSPQPSPHAEAIELLSKQLLVWYKQIGQFNVGDFSDRDARAKNLRKRCHQVEQSIKALEERSQKTEVSSQQNKGEQE